MRSILPIMTGLAVFLVGAMLACAQEPDRVPDGNQLIAQAVLSFADQTSLEAKVRQRATLFGQRVSAAGFLVQLNDGGRVLLRYEFKMQVGDQSTSVLQVNDGKTLWLRRDIGELKSQAYVNVRRLRQAQDQMGSSLTTTSQFNSADLALGGMSEILRNISANFVFYPPRTVELSGLPMWEVVGTWKPELLAQVIPGAPANKGLSGSALPAHMPNTVKLLLGRDRNFPLFPYRIMFGRVQNPDSMTSNGSPFETLIDPMVTMELYEVRRRPDLTAANFAFKPSDDNVENLTDIYLQKLGLIPSEEK